ncbi:MAG: Molybdenum cofactor synthesis domain protein [Candidatus Gallionella acididurans]|uniref:Molybdopterin molybdenumtransferase n=1 Tax=Candidatus Gallionella acididurans TaxID=1796491 RepID=A0A139BVG3_9PROT|nr:MAG: Molybdenum cofactor synthesis domain protein [Candidatus Gallionella acididurans]
MTMEHLSVTDAQQCILEFVKTLGAEPVRLEQSLGRVLADDVYANRDLPPYDVSAMDGYAVRSADLALVPATLSVIEDIKAGDMPAKTVHAGQCARIMTGAPLPAGADAVIRVEDTRASSETEVQINVAVKPGNDIRLQGEAMRNGDAVLAAGTEITPGISGILATVKSAQVRVHRRPRVAILSTGNELEDIDDPVDPDKIPNSNSYALMAQVQALGIEPDLLGIARDDPAELAEYLQRGLKFDVLLVSGGTSVGVHDYVRPILESLGVQMKFWRVAMKPGHPVAFGVLPGNAGGNSKDTFIFGLPGNPVSSMVCFEQFVSPALRRMMGHARIHRRTISARLTHNLKHQPGRTEFVRVTLKSEEGGYAATSTGAQGSGMLLSMARADGLLVVPSDSAGLAGGSMMAVQLLDGTVFQEDAIFKE